MVMKKHNANVVPLLVQFEKENGSISDMDGNDIRLQEFRAKLGFKRVIANDGGCSYTGLQNLIIDNDGIEPLNLNGLSDASASLVEQTIEMMKQGFSNDAISHALGQTRSQLAKLISDYHLKNINYSLHDDNDNTLVVYNSIRGLYMRAVKLGYYDKSMPTFAWRIHTAKSWLSNGMKLSVNKLILIRKIAKS